MNFILFKLISILLVNFKVQCQLLDGKKTAHNLYLALPIVLRFIPSNNNSMAQIKSKRFNKNRNSEPVPRFNKTGLQPVSRPVELVHYFGG